MQLRQLLSVARGRPPLSGRKTVAEIRVIPPTRGIGAVLTEPDEDGDYRWYCMDCGLWAEDHQPIADAIANAEVHVDKQCAGGDGT